MTNKEPEGAKSLLVVLIFVLIVTGIAWFIADDMCDNKCGIHKGKSIEATCHCKVEDGWKESK